MVKNIFNFRFRKITVEIINIFKNFEKSKNRIFENVKNFNRKIRNLKSENFGI